MSFDQLVKFRRSCRKFDFTKEVSDDLIQKVVDAGIYAPTAKNTQGVHFVVIKDKMIKSVFSRVNTQLAGYKFDMFYNAPVIILVLAKKGQYAAYDGSCAIENMLLQASDLGLGSCWIHRAKEEILVPEIKDILNKYHVYAEEYEGVGHVILGFPANDAEIKEKVIKDNRVTWIK